MIGALSVAGLLATVLALASSPATSQQVVTFTTDTQPGSYTVSWNTEGGCDPSNPDADTTLATDGATGSVTRSVNAPAGTAKTAAVDDAVATVGETVEFSVAIAEHCNYEWKATFTSSLGGSDGIRCGIVSGAATAGARDGSLTVPDANEETLEVDETVCTEVADISVSIPRQTTTNDADEIVPLQPHSGAILNTAFTVTATPVKDSNDECVAVTEETEVDDSADESADHTVGATLKVLTDPLSDENATCQYDIAVDLPDGFKAAEKKSDEAKVEDYGLNPANKFVEDGDDEDALPDEPATTAADCGNEVVADLGDDDNLGGEGDNADTKQRVTGDECVSLRVKVAERMMYVLQNVVGDSGGANARYSLTLNKVCAIPHDLPENLLAEEVGGIQTTDSVTVVELREGFFNISAAVMGRDTTDEDEYGRTFAPRYALNSDGEPCSFTAEVSHLPDNCDAAEDSITANAVTGADSHGRVITTFDIGCEEAMDDEAMDDEATDDSGDAMEDMEDDDAMDDEATDDSGDAMEDMEDDDAMEDMEDDDAMGPPPDEPTG